MSRSTVQESGLRGYTCTHAYGRVRYELHRYELGTGTERRVRAGIPALILLFLPRVKFCLCTVIVKLNIPWYKSESTVSGWLGLHSNKRCLFWTEDRASPLKSAATGLWMTGSGQQSNYSHGQPVLYAVWCNITSRSGQFGCNALIAKIAQER